MVNWISKILFSAESVMASSPSDIAMECDQVDLANSEKATEQNTTVNKNKVSCLNDLLDIYILCDTTGSMGDYVNSLVATIIQMVAVTRILLPGRARIAVVSYKDYSDGEEVCTYVPIGSSAQCIVDFVKGLSATGGGDAPEATKTGLNKIADMIRENGAGSGYKSLVIHYTDAPPHCEDSQSTAKNIAGEKKAMKSKEPGFDWVSICRFFGERNIPIYTFLTADSNGLTKSLMLHLGRVVLMRDKRSYNVTKATIGMLMHVLGQEFDYDGDFNMLGCNVRSKTFVGYRRQGWGEHADGDGGGDSELGAVGGSDGRTRGNTPLAMDDYAPHLDLTRNSQIRDETRQGGFPPFREIYPHLSEKVAFHFPSIGMRVDVDEILNRFTSDTQFQDTVFAVLDELLTPESCLALTYNPILGKLWRLVCRRRGDDRLQSLRAKLSDAISGIREERQQKQIKAWLEESYNAEEEIAHLLLTEANYEDSRITRQPCLILDPAAILDADPAKIKEALRSLARAPTPAGLALAQKIMSSLIRIDDASVTLPTSPRSRDDLIIPLSLPLALRTKFLFGCLPHLASPGMMFTLRPAIMIAIMAFLSGNKYLVDQAAAFLQSNVGQWINLDDVTKIPEVLSEETIKLLRRVPQFLTDRENFVYNRLFLVTRLRLAFRREFNVKVPLSPNLKSVFADFRFQCVDCRFYRSFTLLTPGGRCGMCVYKAENPDAEYVVVQSDVEDQETRSRIVCCGSCRCIYEVIKHKDLNVKPKCHFCRLGKPAPTVSCDNCKNRYIAPDASLVERMKQDGKSTWTCRICLTTPHLSFEQVPFLLRDILSSNLHLMNVFNLVEATFNVIDNKASYFKIFTEMWEQMSTTPNDTGDATRSVVVKRRQAVDVAALIDEIKETVEKGDLTDLCFLCCEEKPISQLATSACGHCKNRICYDCQSQWVNQLQPGKVVLPSHLVCPFCKMIPQEAVFKKYNKPAKSLLHKEHLKHVVARMDPSIYYGWCNGCSKICEIAPVECAGAGDVPFSTSDDFVCEACKSSQHITDEVPKCPGCQAPSIKAYGCNHIHCPICGTHWCYVCQQKFDRSTIYDHLVQVHGSIGIEHGEGDEDEYDGNDD